MRIANLLDKIEEGEAVGTRLHERQQEREWCSALTEAETLQHLAVDRATVEAQVQLDVAHWRSLLTGSVADGRNLLRQVLDGKLAFTPDGAGYTFEGTVTAGKAIGRACRGRGLASPAGIDRQCSSTFSGLVLPIPVAWR